MGDTIGVLIRKAPYGMEDAFAGLRLGLATLANGITTIVILMEDGVFNAVKHQNPKKIGMPSIIETLNDLLSLDVKLYCVEDHLLERDILKQDLIDDLIYINEREISDIILNCEIVTSF
jgi:tRNA 2-thiouridine synthesizing protein C